MTKISLFKSDELNQLAVDIIDLDNQYAKYMKQAEENIYSAFETRWLYGKKIYENYDRIIDECGSQKEFAQKVKKSEGVISNNKRAYKNLKEWGCNTFEEVKDLLGNKDIRPTIGNFEKIGTLLNEPDKDTKQTEQIDKDRKRLEDLMEEVGEILKRTAGDGSNPNIDINRDAQDFLEDTKDIKQFLNTFEIHKIDFTSDKYLDFVRSFGTDVLTKEPCERCDPHHVSIGSSKRDNDLLAIPVSRKTHMMIHHGLDEYTERDIYEAVIYTMSTFIRNVL